MQKASHSMINSWVCRSEGDIGSKDREGLSRHKQRQRVFCTFVSALPKQARADLDEASDQGCSHSNPRGIAAPPTHALHPRPGRRLAGRISP